MNISNQIYLVDLLLLLLLLVMNINMLQKTSLELFKFFEIWWNFLDCAPKLVNPCFSHFNLTAYKITDFHIFILCLIVQVVDFNLFVLKILVWTARVTGWQLSIYDSFTHIWLFHTALSPIKLHYEIIIVIIVKFQPILIVLIKGTVVSFSNISNKTWLSRRVNVNIWRLVPNILLAVINVIETQYFFKIPRLIKRVSLLWINFGFI